MHDLIDQLQKSGYGTHVINMCISCIFFADDIVLLSPSRHGLQKLLDICVKYCEQFCLDFNVTKSKIMIVGKALNSEVMQLKLHGVPLEIVCEYKYLGIHLYVNNGLSFSSTATIRSFYRAANSILYSRVKPTNEVLMRLLYSNCVPILTYGCAVKEFSSSDMYKCHVAINNAVRKIYSYAVWQSIRHLRLALGYESIHETFDKAKRKILAFAAKSSNSIITYIATHIPDSC